MVILLVIINMIKHCITGGDHIKLLLIIILLFNLLFIYCLLKIASICDDIQNKK